METALKTEWHIVFTERRQYEGVHSGQISFPGGKQEPGETLAQTAIREAFEEVGVGADVFRLVNPLSKLYIPPSNFLVFPQAAIAEESQLRDEHNILLKEEAELEDKHTRYMKEWNIAKKAMVQNDAVISDLQSKIEEIKSEIASSANIAICGGCVPIATNSSRPSWLNNSHEKR